MRTRVADVSTFLRLSFLRVALSLRGALPVALLLAILLPAMLLPAMTFAQEVATTVADGTMPPPPSFGQLLGKMLPMFVLVFFIFYFMVLRPQATRMKAHQQLIGGLKKGDAVVTSGGLIGRVAGVEKEYIVIEVAAGVKVRVESAHILKRQEAVAEKSAA